MDPFALSDPFRTLGSLSRRPVAAFPPLDEPEADSAIARLTAGTLGGLGYVGSLQDKLGGRAVRGLLGGKPRELLSLVPFSDSLGITDPADVTSGEDLWRQIGYDPARGNWLERNLVGPALEVGLDPTTYLGGIGALTAAGRAARMRGTLTKGFLPAVRAGQRSLIYGGNDLIPGLLTGKRAADVAEGAVKLGGKALDLAEHVPLAGVGVKLARDRLVPVLRSAFDYTAGPVPHRVVQAAYGETYLPAKEAAEAAARERVARLYDDLQPVIDAGADRGELGRWAMQRLEGVPPSRAPSLIPHARFLQGIVGQVKRRNAEILAAEKALGLPSSELQSLWGLDYATRQALSATTGGEGAAARVKPLPVTQRGRRPYLDVPGGSMQIEDYLHDPEITGPGRAWEDKDVRDYILGDIYSRAGVGTAGTPLAPGILAATEKRSGQLGRWLKKRPLLEAGESFWNPDFLAMHLLREYRGAKASGAGQALYDVIGRSWVKGGIGTPVTKVLKDAQLGGAGALESAARAVGLDVQALKAQAQGKVDPKVFRQALSEFVLPGDVAAAATDLINRYVTSRELVEPRVWGDSLLNLAKTGLYAIWPASHARNFASGVWENWLAGTPPSSKAYGDAVSLLSGAGIDTGIASNVYGLPVPEVIIPKASGREVVEAAAEAMRAGIDPAGRRLVYEYIDPAGDVTRAFHGPEFIPRPVDEQRLRFLEEAFGRKIIGSPQGELLQRVGVPEHTVGAGNPSLPRMTGSVLGDARASLARLKAGLATPEGRDPLGIAGVGGRVEDTFAPVKWGREAGTNVEDRLRVAQYLDRRRKGFTPQAAAEAVRDAHFDYSRLTDFEKLFMKRVFPFYTFSRFNLPKQFRRAFEEPLKTSIPLRVAAQGRAQGGYVPEYLRSGLAIPVGDEGDGTQRYLSQVGLPFEEAFSRLKLGATPTQTLAKTGLGLLGNVRGDVGSLLEYVTGKDFFTGRDLADLRPGKVESLGGLLDEDTSGFLSQALQATPASRMVGTLNRMLDERKGLPTKLLSLASGARLTDVDVDKWRAVDARRALEDLMQRSRRIRESTDYWIPKEQRAQATPDEASMLELYAALKLRARRAVDEQRRVGVQVGGR